MSAFGIALEEAPSGATIAWSLEWPEVSGQGPTDEAAIADLHHRLDRHAIWLQRHYGVHVALDGELTVREHHASSGYPDLGETSALLSVDRVGMNDESFQLYERLLRWSRQDLLNTAEECTRENRAGIDVDGIMGHLARNEWWAASRISGSPAEQEDLPAGLPGLKAYEAARSMLLGRFLAYAKSLPDTTQIYARDGELWTVRKVFRRALWHELYHLRVLKGE